MSPYVELWRFCDPIDISSSRRLSIFKKLNTAWEWVFRAYPNDKLGSVLGVFGGAFSIEPIVDDNDWNFSARYSGPRFSFEVVTVKASREEECLLRKQ